MLTEAATPPAPFPRREKVIWVSHNFGYGSDLMYFGEIFRSFRAHFPNMLVCVDAKRRIDDPYSLNLKPVLRKVSIPLVRRTTANAGPVQGEFPFPVP